MGLMLFGLTAGARGYRVLYLGADLVTSRVLVFGVGRNAASLLIKDDGNLPTSSYRIVGFIGTPEQNRFVPEEKIVEIGDSLLGLGAGSLVLGTSPHLGRQRPGRRRRRGLVDGPRDV